MKREDQMKFHELQALWHIASATTGACKTKDIRHGNDIPFTDDEKVKDELDTAQIHIRLFHELSEKTW